MKLSAAVNVGTGRLALEAANYKELIHWIIK